MITSSRLIQQADTDGVPTPTVERDFVLTHVLAAIASTPDAHRMIFKGGTALRLCSSEDYRSSADLDFSLVDGMTADEGGTQSPRRSTTLCHSTHLPNPSAPFRTMYAAAQT